MILTAGYIDGSGGLLTSAFAGFSPASLPDLALWLDASKLSGLSDGDPVASWPDLSGNGNNAAQATLSSKPVYKTALQNGLPLVRFDGVDDFLSGAMQTLTGASFLMVAKLLSTPTHGGVFCLNDGVRVDYDTAGSTAIFWDSGDNLAGGISGADAYWRGYAGALGNMTLTSGVMHQYDMVVGQAGALTATVTADGAVIGSAAISQLANAVTQYSVGCRLLPAPGAYCSQIDVCEALVYSAALDAASVTTLRSYLKAKWGTP